MVAVYNRSNSFISCLRHALFLRRRAKNIERAKQEAKEYLSAHNLNMALFDMMDFNTLACRAVRSTSTRFALWLQKPHNRIGYQVKTEYNRLDNHPATPAAQARKEITDGHQDLRHITTGPGPVPG